MELASSTSGGPKFKIQQSVPSGSIKRGPHAIVRSADLNDGIEIKRRFGEGSKPLFARDDIAVNQTSVREPRDSVSGQDHYACYKSKTKRGSSTETSSSERYCHRNINKHSTPTPSHRRSSRDERPSNSNSKYANSLAYGNVRTDSYMTLGNKSSSLITTNKKPTEKLPYYRDEQRERDRLKRLYGRTRSGTSPSPVKTYGSTKRSFDSPPRRRRSTSNDRYCKHSPYHSSSKGYRCRRSRTRSKTRSPQRHVQANDKYYNSRERDKGQRKDFSSFAAAVIPPTPQFIPIPVAVPADYAYSFPAWPTPQPSWPSSHRPPPAPHFTPYPMLPMMPPMRLPHQSTYGGFPPPLPYAPIPPAYRPHGLQRYPPHSHNINRYQPRHKKPLG